MAGKRWGDVPAGFTSDDDELTEEYAAPATEVIDEPAPWDPQPPVPTTGWVPYDRPARPPSLARIVASTAVVAALVGGVVGGGVAYLVDKRQDESALRDPSASLGTGTTTPKDISPGSVAAVAEKVLPSVVSIGVQGFDGNGTGSGVIIRSDGYILTNNHVVAGASDIQVRLANGSEVSASLVGRDADTDVAVIKTAQGGLPPAELGRSNNLQVGDPVVAIGSPLGLTGSVTAGIISALNRNVDVPGAILSNAIQTDAAINPGNSGGALADRLGRVIGINSAIATAGGTGGSIGVGFAIPIAEARVVAEEIIRTGKATLPFLGIANCQDVTPAVAERFNLGEQRGVFCLQVIADGPAAKAGLRAQDIIVAFGGQPVTTFNDLVAAIRSHKVGEQVPLTYIRDGQRQSAEATLEEKPAQP